jgi:bifunctional non-homologous end joining protein LigD
VRARPGMGVSVPVEWAEVPTLASGAQWTLRNIHARLDRGNDPWAGYAKAAVSPGAAMKRLGFEAAKLRAR